MSPAIHTKDKKTDAVTTTTRKLETNEREREVGKVQVSVILQQQQQ